MGRARTRPDRSRPPGIAMAVAAAALFGLTMPLAKLLLGGCAPQMLAGLFYLGSGLGLSLLWAAGRRTRRRRETSLGSRDLPWLGGAVVMGGVFGPLLAMVGLSRLTASTASLLLNLEAVFTAAVAWGLVREHVSSRTATGMAAIVAGGCVLAWSGPEGGTSWSGIAALAAACLCWGLDNNLTQRIASRDPLQIAAVKGLVAGFVNVGVGWRLGGGFPGGVVAGAALAVGAAGYGASLWCYILALRSLGTARTGAWFGLAPFIGAVAAVLVWREPPTWPLAVAAALMGLGAWLHVTEGHAHEHAHERLKHAHAHVHDPHHRHRHRPDDPPGEPHTHRHVHPPLVHAHPHFPDLHHRHAH